MYYVNSATKDNWNICKTSINVQGKYDSSGPKLAAFLNFYALYPRKYRKDFILYLQWKITLLSEAKEKMLPVANTFNTSPNLLSGQSRVRRQACF